MNKLRREMRALVRRLESSSLPVGGIEEEALHRLQSLCAAADRAEQISDMSPLFEDLKTFWLNAIDWCSQLSKEIERLLILQDELRARGCPDALALLERDA